MASSTTIADIVTQVRYLLGEATAARWTADELTAYIELALTTVVNDLPIQSVPELHKVALAAFNTVALTHVAGDVRSVYGPADLAKLITLSVEDDSTGYFEVWSKLSQPFFFQVRMAEAPQTTATTDTRIFTESDDGETGHDTRNTYLLFPGPESLDCQLRYVGLPDITGTMTLPTEYVNFEEMWSLKSAEIALVKKAYDQELSTHFHNLYNEKLELVRAKHGNI